MESMYVTFGRTLQIFYSVAGNMTRFHTSYLKPILLRMVVYYYM